MSRRDKDSDARRGMETQNGTNRYKIQIGQSHIYVWYGGWISGGILQEQGIPSPNQTTQPRVTVPGRYIPITSGCKNQWGWERRKKLWCSQDPPLKGPAKDLGLMQTHSLWASAPGQQIEGHQWHMGRNLSDWQKGKYQETASSWTKFQRPGSGIVPSLSPSPHRATEQWHHVWA